MVLVGIFSSLFDICMKAAIPVMMGKADTLRANSILLGGRNFVVAGSALCAVFAHVWMTRFDTIFVIDAVTYLISGFVLLTVNIKTSELPVSSQACAIGMVAKPKPVRKNIFGEYAEIWRLRNAPILFLFMTVMFIDAFASASHNVGWPLFSKSYSPERPMFLYGFVLFFWAGGNVLGIVFLNKLAMLKRLAPEVLYLFFTIMMSVGMILTFAFDAKLLIAVAALIAGVGDGTYQTYFTTYVQKVDDAVRGKVFALTNIFLKTGFGLGFIVIPMVMDSLGPAWTAALFHGLVVLCCGLGLWYPTSVMVRCFASKGQMLCVKGSNAERQRVRC
ncbi:MAG TPA: MFS transporter, partial [bacterium]|nr:MFS transporter [bacterium]